jgi:hypothetical protein
MRSNWRIFAFIGILLPVTVSMLSAQELAGRISTTNGAVSTTALSIAQDPSHTSDVFYGTDSKGPYTLSWKPIQKFSEDVTVDGKSVQRGIEYDMDYTSGNITFTQAVGSSQAISVQYRCDFSTATRNQNTLSTPLSLDVMGSGVSSLKFTGLYQQGSGGASGQSNLAVAGLSGSTKIAGIGFNTMFLTAPGSSGNGGSAIDRSAMSFSGSTKSGGLELSSSFSRVGASFANAGNYNLTQGQQALNFIAKLQASKTLSLVSSYTHTDSLESATAGQSTTTTSEGMVFTPLAGSKLSFTKTDVNSDAPASSATSTSTDKLDLSQALGSRVSAAASYQDVTSQTNGTDSRTVTNQLSLTAKPTNTMSINTQLVDQTTTASGKDDSQALSFSAAPSAALKLDMNVKHEDSETLGSALTESLHLVSAPSAAWKLDYSMAGNSATAEPTTDTLSHTLQLSNMSVKATTIQLKLGLTDSGTSGNTQQAGIDVETSPLKNAKLGGGYQEIANSDGTLARVTRVNASGQPVSFLSLSGGYATRQQDGVADVNSLNVAVQVKPGNFLAVTGAYAMNPEDGSGTVQKVNSQTVGVESKFGCISLKGAYTRKNDYNASTFSEVRQLGLDCHLGATSTLSTSYSLEDDRATTDLLTSTYALTLSHKVGSNLSLYLTGKAIMYQGQAGSDVNPNDYEGEASLGLKF